MTRSTQKRILVIIPCYNEEASITSVVADIRRVKNRYELPLDVLVVNDCSTDGTLACLKQIDDCQYLNLPINLGIGGAMQAGYRYAYRNNYDIAIQMDGDGQHPADELVKILEPLFADEADVVIGSRFIEKSGFQSTAIRRIGINYFRRLNRWLIGQTVYDSTSGYRAFNRKTLCLVDQYYPDEYPEPEAIVQFGLNQLRIKEVPVQMKERQGGVSSIGSTQALYYMLKVTLGILFVYIRLRGRKDPSPIPC
ncbi:glycosyltransferase family 2 protein [Spirosoma harenae]